MRNHWGGILHRAGNREPRDENIDSLMQEIIVTIKHHERKVPKSRYRKNIKSYWCPELDVLKQVKVQAFKAWTDARRPRECTNPLFEVNKVAKKNFRKRLKKISRDNDENKIKEAVQKAELDHTTFWKMLKRERDVPRVKTPSIKKTLRGRQYIMWMKYNMYGEITLPPLVHL